MSRSTRRHRRRTCSTGSATTRERAQAALDAEYARAEPLDADHQAGSDRRQRRRPCPTETTADRRQSTTVDRGRDATHERADARAARRGRARPRTPGSIITAPRVRDVDVEVPDDADAATPRAEAARGARRARAAPRRSRPTRSSTSRSPAAPQGAVFSFNGDGLRADARTRSRPAQAVVDKAVVGLAL